MTIKSARSTPKKSASKVTIEVKKTKLASATAKSAKKGAESSEPDLKATRHPKQSPKQSSKLESKPGSKEVSKEVSKDLSTRSVCLEQFGATPAIMEELSTSADKANNLAKPANKSPNKKSEIAYSTEISATLPGSFGAVKKSSELKQTTGRELESVISLKSSIDLSTKDDVSQFRPSEAVSSSSRVISSEELLSEENSVRESSVRESSRRESQHPSAQGLVEGSSRNFDVTSDTDSGETESIPVGVHSQETQKTFSPEQRKEINNPRPQHFDSRDQLSRNHSYEQTRRDFNQNQGAYGNRDSRSVKSNFAGQARNGYKDESLIEVKLSGSLFRKLRDIARNEGLTVEEFASELLAEGCVVRAWEVIERKAAMKGQTPNNNQIQNRNNSNGYNNKQNYNPRSKQGRSNYNKIMEDNAHFLEYVRNQEKRQR